MSPRSRVPGFTLVELLVALLIFSLLAFMSYRGLGAMLETRSRVAHETEKWQRLESFFTRFARDVRLASPRPVRTASGIAPAWLGIPTENAPGLRLEFSRFAAISGTDRPRRMAYVLDAHHDIELWVWPGLDMPAGTAPQRYPVLERVSHFTLQYMDPRGVWVNSWPYKPGAPAIPLAVRISVELVSGQRIVRIFALGL